MQAVVEVEHHGNIVAGGLELHRFDKRIQRHVLKMHFRDVDDKRRAFLLRGGEQRAQEVGVEHVKRAQRVAMFLACSRPSAREINGIIHSLYPKQVVLVAQHQQRRFVFFDVVIAGNGLQKVVVVFVVIYR
jgi:hypothetical protein